MEQGKHRMQLCIDEVDDLVKKIRYIYFDWLFCLKYFNLHVLYFAAVDGYDLLQMSLEVAWAIRLRLLEIAHE